jgi:hypothetical protein
MTGQLDIVLAEVVAFRRKLPLEVAPWDAMFLGVLDQLTAPHRYLLRDAPYAHAVPVPLAVGHKLAAGFFGVLMKTRRNEILSGESVPASVEQFLQEVREQKALIGLSEVCAGPPNLIERCAQAWLGPIERAHEVLRSPKLVDRPIDEGRLELARILATQIELGTAFGLFDNRVEADLLRRFGGQLEPRNPFIRRRLVERRIQIIEHEPVPQAAPLRALPRTLSGKRLAMLEGRFLPQGPSQATYARLTVATLIHEKQGALTLDGSAQTDELASEIVNYFRAYQQLVQAQWEMEQSLRGILQTKDGDLLKLSSLQRPLPRALDWMEALLGYRLVCEPCALPTLSLRSHLRHVPLHMGGPSLTSAPPSAKCASNASG